MKLKIAILVVGVIALTSCKKNHECECTSVYTNAEGVYAGSQDDVKYHVKNRSECEAYNKSTATEVKTCTLDD